MPKVPAETEADRLPMVPTERLDNILCPSLAAVIDDAYMTTSGNCTESTSSEKRLNSRAAVSRSTAYSLKHGTMIVVSGANVVTKIANCSHLLFSGPGSSTAGFREKSTAELSPSQSTEQRYSTLKVSRNKNSIRAYSEPSR